MLAVHHHLADALRILDDQRRGPAGGLVPRRLPDDTAGPPVHREQHRALFVIPGHEHEIAGDRRRRALAEAVADGHVAEVAAPEVRAIDRVGVEPAGAEVGIHPCAVGAGGGGGEAIGLVRPLVRHRLHGRPRPAFAARRAIEAQEPEVEHSGRAVDRHGRGDEHHVAHDDRRRRPLPGNLDAPGQLLVGSERHGGPRRERHAVAAVAPPVRPITTGRGGTRHQQPHEHTPGGRPSHGGRLRVTSARIQSSSGATIEQRSYRVLHRCSTHAGPPAGVLSWPPG